MRIIIITAAAATAAIATPALAADGPYVGIEGGVTLPKSTDLDIVLNNTTVSPNTSVTYPDGFSARTKYGWDGDVIAGFKLGNLFRIEGEGGYQRAAIRSLTVSPTLLGDVTAATGTTATSTSFPGGGHIRVAKLMANALIDGDLGGGFGAYAGVGAGRAWADYAGSKDNAWAYQGIAGIRYALTPNLDAGVKYEYFRTANLNFNDAFTVNGDNYTAAARGKFTSNNILASLVYHFNSGEQAAPTPAAMPAPPPPPPPPPATQTCPDGSVIDATATCPAPPPPPPPPPPPAQRGERG